MLNPRTIMAIGVMIGVVGIWLTAQQGGLQINTPEVALLPEEPAVLSTSTSLKKSVSNAPAVKINPTSTAPTAPQIKKDTGGDHLSLTYKEALNLYGDRHIQFNKECKMISSRSTFKNRVSIMFDNRHNEDRYFSLDGVRYYLRASDFRILILESPSVPHTVNIGCDTKEDVGEIILN